MIKKTVFFIFFITSIFSNASVTYELAGSTRFGDNLLCYIHAKWISYKYNIDFLYKPFKYSYKLVLDEKEIRYDDRLFKDTISYSNDTIINKDNVVYKINYFPESSYERKLIFWPCCFDVDWDDIGFVEIMRKYIYPKKNVLNDNRVLDNNKINIAVHYREGGGYDSSSAKSYWPLKFPSLNYYIKQINFLLELFKGNNFYIYVFTDSKNPGKISKEIGNHIKFNDNVVIDYRKNNSHDSNVLEDFFFMMKFTCIIRSDSNFSNIAAKIGKPLIEIYPVSYVKKNNENEITEFKILYNRKEFSNLK